MALDLEAVRNEIDAADDELVAVFCRRMKLAEQVAAYKIEHQMPVLRPEREQVILDRVEQLAGADYGAYARDLYLHVLRESREMQQKMMDAYELQHTL